MLTGPQNSGVFISTSACDRLNATRARIARAAQKFSRPANDVLLLAVSKMQPPEAIRAMAECGQRDFGENYLQEALGKQNALADLALTWHFIGHIQSNKTAAIAERFDWVHTVDRERIAARLNDQRPHDAAALNVCLQVKLGDEPGKGGVAIGELQALALRCMDFPRLRLRGLMCIPPVRVGFEEQYELLQRLREQLHRLRAAGFEMDTLSMGMSADLEAAIAAGATIVRIGTALFGERKSTLDMTARP